MRITGADKTTLESMASSPGSHAKEVTEAVEKKYIQRHWTASVV
jgi:hypothetical protein